MTRTADPILESLLRQILKMGSLAEGILEKALRSLAERDAAIANEVQRDDLAIDQLDVDIDTAVLQALALQAPVAGELRQVIASKTIAIYLERVGDLSRNIAKGSARLAEAPEISIPAGLTQLGSLVQRQLRLALDAFSNHDAERARQVLEADDEVDDLQDQLVSTQIDELRQDPGRAGQHIDLILIAEHLERVGDHATNIAEDVILVTEAANVKHLEKLSHHRSAPGTA